MRKTRGQNYTGVEFQPDLEKFQMTKLDEDIMSLLRRRAYDVAGSGRGMKVYFNGPDKLPTTSCLILISNSDVSLQNLCISYLFGTDRRVEV